MKCVMSASTAMTAYAPSFNLLVRITLEERVAELVSLPPDTPVQRGSLAWRAARPAGFITFVALGAVLANMLWGGRLYQGIPPAGAAALDGRRGREQ